MTSQRDSRRLTSPCGWPAGHTKRDTVPHRPVGRRGAVARALAGQAEHARAARVIITSCRRGPESTQPSGHLRPAARRLDTRRYASAWRTRSDTWCHRKCDPGPPSWIPARISAIRGGSCPSRRRRTGDRGGTVPSHP